MTLYFLHFFHIVIENKVNNKSIQFYVVFNKLEVKTYRELYHIIDWVYRYIFSGKFSMFLCFILQI